MSVDKPHSTSQNEMDTSFSIGTLKSYPGAPDPPSITEWPSLQQNDTDGPSLTSFDVSLFSSMDILSDLASHYVSPLYLDRNPFPMESQLQTMLSPLVPSPQGPSLVDPHDSQQHIPNKRKRHPSDPPLEAHWRNSKSPASSPYIQSNLNKEGGYSNNVSSSPLPPENYKRVRWDYDTSNVQSSQPDDQNPDRSGNVDHNEPLAENLTYIGTGLQFPPRISISSIPTSTGELSFQYSPIRPTEFRLVRLLPEIMSMINCEIIHTSFGTNQKTQEYIAVSYTWGDVDPSIKIQVNGLPFYITPNLHGALRRLRKRSEPVMLWVDALCINQRNNEEQSQQVALMTAIYGRAKSVAAWLGPKSDNSELAFELIRGLSSSSISKSVMIADKKRQHHFTALVNLFERDFWSRLWIVQEIINARTAYVYCGDSVVSWDVLEAVCVDLQRHKADIRRHFPQGKMKDSRQGRSYAHVLCSQGPASLIILRPSANNGCESLLKALRICRTKLAADPRDKVFGVLGILPEDVQGYLRPNYNSSLREVYTTVVDLIVHSTHRVDIICDAIYYPIYTSTVKLPTWVPDWSFIPSTTALGSSSIFSAASDVDAEFEFLNLPQRTHLKVAAIYIDQLKIRGTAVGTFCTLDDYLMAFLHWQANPFAWLVSDEVDPKVRKQNDEAFCRTLAMGGVSDTQGKSTWQEICYYVFTSLISDRLPSISLNDHLKAHTNPVEGISPQDRRNILQDNCASNMQGRCFFTTTKKLMGMGSGFMRDGDIICVPLGCKTPIILREDGNNEYRLVGDAYIDGYMTGRAVEEWKKGKRELCDYILH
ncbi:heterokaryon incompatibility protein-domain-containing protein [Xylaria cf. heliscus]|nr:heterokaryon incompatibility protein-domain-containing protein [Xylaria cf. heliscus]